MTASQCVEMRVRGPNEGGLRERLEITLHLAECFLSAYLPNHNFMLHLIVRID